MDRRSLLKSLFILTTIFSNCIAVFAQTKPTLAPDDREETFRASTISGWVVNENGQPLANVSVFVRAFGPVGQGRSTSTDDEGSFQVSGLNAAPYSVSAAFPAYITMPRDPDSSQSPYYRVGESVKLELIKGGVITGLVTSSADEPVVAVPVRAYMIRDSNGQPSRYGMPFRERPTDDRGLYRIYGLAPGTYIVSAGGGSNVLGFNLTAFDTDTPTYAPSSARDTAAEINVRAGEETGSVDIRYRGEPGHVVSGTARGPIAPGEYSAFTVTLTAVSNTASQLGISSFQPAGRSGFAFYGIADGDYDITAQSFFPGGEWTVSEHRLIKIRGANITGLELTTKPLGTIRGHIALEDSRIPECKDKRRPLFAETLVTPWHNEKNVAKDQPQFVWSFGGPTLPDKQGDFTLRNLAPGQYRINTRSFARYWYLQSISLQSSAVPGVKAATTNRPFDAVRNWITLKSGDQISGLTITIAEGAASFHGQMKFADGQKLPSRLFFYLVPAERERAEDPLRFFASQVAADGSFALNNLPPGRYWTTAKAAGDNETNVLSKLRLPDETEARAKLRAEAAAAKMEIELKPCQNVEDYKLPFN